MWNPFLQIARKIKPTDVVLFRMMTQWVNGEEVEESEHEQTQFA